MIHVIAPYHWRLIYIESIMLFLCDQKSIIVVVLVVWREDAVAKIRWDMVFVQGEWKIVFAS